MEKINYSKTKTLKNIEKWYKFELSKKISVLWLKDSTFKKWDTIIIKEIKLKKDKPHNVNFDIIREGEKIKNINMSWWVFLSNFVNEIDSNLIILKSETKEKIDKIIK